MKIFFDHVLSRVLFFLLAFAPPAQAAPCQPPSFYDGYGGQFFNTSVTNGFIYGLDEQYLYVTLVNGNTTGFINVPQSTVQVFNAVSTPDSYYTTNIYNVYRQPLMTNNCNNLLVNSNTYLVIR